MKPRHRELPVAVKPGDPPKPFPRSLGKGLPCFVVLSAGISCFGVHAQTDAGMKYHPEGSATMLTAAVFQLNQEYVKSADTQHLGFWTQTGETCSRGAGMRYSGSSGGNPHNIFKEPSVALDDLAVSYDLYGLTGTEVTVPMNVSNLAGKQYTANCRSDMYFFIG